MTFQRRKYLATMLLIAFGLIAHLYVGFAMYLSATIVYAMGFLSALITLGWNERRLHPVSILVFTSALYFLAAPLELVTTSNYTYYKEDITFSFMLPNVVFLASLLLFTPSVDRLRQIDRLRPELAQSARTLSIASTFVAVLVYFLINVPQFGVDLSVALDRGEVQISLGAGGFLAEAAIAAFVLLHALLYFRYGCRVSLGLVVAVSAYCVYDILILGDRRATVGLALGILALRAMERGFRFRLRYVPIIFFGAFLLQIWTFGRSIGFVGTIDGILDGSFWQIFKVRFGETEFAAATIVLNQQWYDLQVEFFWSYRHLPLQIIPNFILNPMGIEQPDSPSLYFVKKYFPTVAYEGGAFGYNIVLEAYQNLGLIGYLLVPAFIARVGGLLYRVMPLSQTLYYALFIASCGFLVRLDMSNLKSWLYSCVIVFVAMTFLSSTIYRRYSGSLSGARNALSEAEC